MMNPEKPKEIDCYCVCHSPISSRPYCEHCGIPEPLEKSYTTTEVVEILERLKEHSYQEADQLENDPYVVEVCVIDQEIEKIRGDSGKSKRMA